MAIQILNSPPNFHALGNQTVFRVKSTNAPVESAAGYFALEFDLGVSPATNGQSFTFAFLGYTFTFQFATTPNDSGFQLPLVANMTTLATALKLCQILNKHYQIVAPNANKLQITSRVAGAGFEIVSNLSGTTFFTGPSFSFTPAAASTDVYKIGCNLVIETDYFNSQSIRLEEFFADPDANAEAPIFVDQILNSYLKEKFDLPFYNQANISRCVYFFLRWKPEFFESKNGIAQKILDSGNTIYTGFRFKFPEQYFPLAYTNASNFYLTHTSLKRQTWYEAQQFISVYLATQVNVNIGLRCQVTYKDGTTEAQTLFVQNFNYSIHEAAIIPAGAAQLNLAGLFSHDEIQVYYLWLINNDTSAMITIPVSYELIEKPTYYSKQLIYINNYYGVETVLIDGITENALAVEKETLKRPLPRNYGIKDTQFIQNIISQNEAYKTATGYRSKQDSENLKQLFASPYVFLVDEAAEEFIRILIEPGEYKFSDDDETTLKTIEFSFRTAFDGSLDSFNKRLSGSPHNSNFLIP